MLRNLQGPALWLYLNRCGTSGSAQENGGTKKFQPRSLQRNGDCHRRRSKTKGTNPTPKRPLGGSLRRTGLSASRNQ